MVAAGVCEWTSAERNRAFIWWKSPDDWANDLMKFALGTGEIEVVETLQHFRTEAGSPVLHMAEEVILRICQTVSAEFLFPCATHGCNLDNFSLQLVGKNKALIVESESGGCSFSRKPFC
jgi:hypothetical protein